MLALFTDCDVTEQPLQSISIVLVACRSGSLQIRFLAMHEVGEELVQRRDWFSDGMGGDIGD
jgi:hypothetical protein